MDEFNFPKRKKSNQKGQSGSAFVNLFVNDQLGWIYHNIDQANDFGIDAYIEIVENEKATGKLIGIQIKHGNSYFSNKSIGGYKFYGDRKHLNYYLNMNLPIIIIILNDDFSNNLWILFDLKITDSTENGWSLEIPDSNILNNSVIN